MKLIAPLGLASFVVGSTKYDVDQNGEVAAESAEHVEALRRFGCRTSEELGYLPARLSSEFDSTLERVDTSELESRLKDAEEVGLARGQEIDEKNAQIAALEARLAALEAAAAPGEAPSDTERGHGDAQDASEAADADKAGDAPGDASEALPDMDDRDAMVEWLHGKNVDIAKNVSKDRAKEAVEAFLAAKAE